MNQNRLERYIRKFAELKKDNFKKLDLEKGEIIKHCIDNRDMKYYQEAWAVTSRGRIWSLGHNMWLNPRNQKGYWRVANVYVHELVNYYFMSDDEKMMLRYVEKRNKNSVDSEILELEVHHLEEVQIVDSSVMTKDARIKACMESNHKGNLILQIKEDHRDSHRILKGKKTKGEEKGTEQFDVFMSVMRNSGVETAYVSYDGDGKKQYNVKNPLKGMMPEEELEYSKDANIPFLLW